MDTKDEALKLGKEVAEEIIGFGTRLDEYYRRFRDLRLRTEDLSFQSALLKVEHSFFMVVQSLNILREHLALLGTASRKKEIG